MLSRTARTLLIGISVAGFTLASVPSASATRWIVIDADTRSGNEAGSTRPCEVAGTGDNGASHRTLGEEGACWVVLPQGAQDNMNPKAIKGTWTG